MSFLLIPLSGSAAKVRYEITFNRKLLVDPVHVFGIYGKLFICPQKVGKSLYVGLIKGSVIVRCNGDL